MILQNKTEMRRILRLIAQSCCFVLCLWACWQTTKSHKAEHQDPQLWVIMFFLPHPDHRLHLPDLKTASCWEISDYGWELAAGISVYLLLTIYLYNSSLVLLSPCQQESSFLIKRENGLKFCILDHK